MKLIRYPDPILDRRSSELTEVDLESVKNVIQPMTDLMLKCNGVGLAAVQVAIVRRFAVLNMKADPYYDVATPAVLTIINPEILETKNPVRLTEGCLSLPLYSEFQDRYADITVKYRDLDWNEVTKEFSGVIAQCIQHEILHMNGTLLIHADSPMKVQMYRKKLKKRGAL